MSLKIKTNSLGSKIENTIYKINKNDCRIQGEKASCVIMEPI